MTTRLHCLLLVFVMLAAGCVRHKTVQDFGLIGQPSGRAAPSRDTSLRALFQKQTQGAFNPRSDDPRIRTLEIRLITNHADVDAHLELGAIYETYRLHQDALAEYTAAYDLQSSEKAILGIVRCDQALNRAWQAIPLLEQFLKENPSAVAWNALGLLHDASADFAAGEKAFHEAVAVNPLSDQFHNNLGYNLLLQNKLDAAEAELRKSLHLNAKSVTAHNNLGMLLARRGDLDGAFKEFRFDADEATAHNNLAVVLMESGKYDESREELFKALAVRRNFAPALSNFKLVQERLRLRAELQKRAPASDVRVATAEQESSPLEKSKEQ